MEEYFNLSLAADSKLNFRVFLNLPDFHDLSVG